MPRLALLLLALALPACDAAGDGVAYDGVVEVSAGEATESSASIRLVAVEDTGCGLPLRTSVGQDARTRVITVEGIGETPAAACEAIIPASAVVVFPTGPDLLRVYPIEVRHAGATDRYTLSVEGFAPGSVATLTAVRTSTTRLAGGP